MKLDPKKFRVSTHFWSKREFNPTSSIDLAQYKRFMETSNWESGCPFILEWPYHDVPTMIKQRIVERHLNNIISTVKKETA
jgi:hypothetical protein